LTGPSTFSIAGVDSQAGEVGVAVQSKFLAVGALVPWARGSVGAVATQAFAEVTFGSRGLDLVAQGLDPQEVIDRLLADDTAPEQRQVGIVDSSGRSAAHTGSECFEWAGHETGEGFSCQGNILAGADVVTEMARSFRQSSGPLATRLVDALKAGQRAGGDRRGQESAALYVAKPGAGYGGNHDRYVDLRVDHHDEPIEELSRLLELHELYFRTAPSSDILDVDALMEREIGEMLRALDRFDAERGVWDSLSDYLGWENLEERWAGVGKIDPRVLAYLRGHAAAGDA
jgi:uncharacterized Ntn-hydrolase superfamily protein